MASLFLWIVLLWVAPYRAAKKIISGPAYAAPKTVEIDDTGLRSHSSALQSSTSWESIIGWEEVDRVFAVFLSSVSFIPIPKRAMTEAQQQEFRALLQKHVTDRLKNE